MRTALHVMPPTKHIVLFGSVYSHIISLLKTPTRSDSVGKGDRQTSVKEKKKADVDGRVPSVMNVCPRLY